MQSVCHPRVSGYFRRGHKSWHLCQGQRNPHRQATLTGNGFPWLYAQKVRASQLGWWYSLLGWPYDFRVGEEDACWYDIVSKEKLIACDTGRAALWALLMVIMMIPIWLLVHHFYDRWCIMMIHGDEQPLMIIVMMNFVMMNQGWLRRTTRICLTIA